MIFSVRIPEYGHQADVDAPVDWFAAEKCVQEFERARNERPVGVGDKSVVVEVYAGASDTQRFTVTGDIILRYTARRLDG